MGWDFFKGRVAWILFWSVYRIGVKLNLLENSVRVCLWRGDRLSQPPEWSPSKVRPLALIRLWHKAVNG
ncbi:hypothetical protein [Laspinema olomoucense]|uniref:hypothetical protein n=1 Tax=Laspinema olomoucense TaxID=3231600 RepID=UPI0021BABB18|nr:hypothetical protein [Laspinema sp. D3c]MCT7996103.1 hypothetical protein [Laspinema sp. D3c]